MQANREFEGGEVGDDGEAGERVIVVRATFSERGL